MDFMAIGKVEKLAKNHDPFSPAGFILYGCRILKPLETMKALDKMAARWSLAWCGSDHGEIHGVHSTSTDWQHRFRTVMQPFTIQQIERALLSQKKLSRTEAYALFYPEIPPPSGCVAPPPLPSAHPAKPPALP